MIKLNVGGLISGEQGTIEKITIKENVEFEPRDPKLLSPITGEIELIRLSDAVTLMAKEIIAVLAASCNRCNNSCEIEIKVKNTEAHFYMEVPPRPFDKEEVRFFVDMKHSTIDIYPFLREEILLQFPLIPLCSTRCKGLCDKCGQNLNKRECRCEKKSVKSNPFSILKK